MYWPSKQIIINGIIIMSAGFKETGKQGKALEEELKKDGLLFKHFFLTIILSNLQLAMILNLF